METKKRTLRIQGLATGLLALSLAGCAARSAHVRGEREMERQAYDAAVLDFSKAVSLKPGNVSYSTSLARAKARAADLHFERGKLYLTSGQLRLALVELEQTLVLNPGHQHARNELQHARRELERLENEPSEIEQLKEQARRRDLGPPKLDPHTNIPILLNFKEVPIGKIFEAIGKASGINFIYDDKTDLEKPLTIDLGNVSLEKALDILMLQTKNFYKVIDEYTLLLAPDSRQKRQEYEDQVIRTFFLSNADTKEVVTLLRSLLQARQIAENVELNSVTIKDTPDKVAIAERILLSNDKSKGEVLIDVELMEINRTTARTLGIDLSSKVMSLTFGDGEASVPLNNLNSLRQTANWALGVIPSVVLNFLRSDSDTRFIAQPQLRVSEGESAELLIGDRVPIPTTSFNTSQTVGGNIVPITSFTYQNVGITVKLEPRVHHNKEVTLKVQIELSQVTGTIDAGQTEQPIIGTRQIQTVIRLRDGETNMLAGLVTRRNEDTNSSIVGIGDIPALRRIFGTTDLTHTENDIVLTLTPRIIRIPDITEQDLAALWVGTEENMTLRGPARSALNQGPFHRAEDYQPMLADAASDAPVGGSLNRIAPSPDEEPPRANGNGTRPGAEVEDPRAVPPPPPPGGQVPAEVPADEPRSRPPAEEPADDDANDDAGAVPSGPATVKLVPTRSSFAVGEQFTVNVAIENASNVGSVPFHLRYDTRVVQFLGPATEGPFLGSDGRKPIFLATDMPSGGEIVVGLSRLGGAEGVSGAGVLASFQFLAVAPGDAGFAFTGASVKSPLAGNLPASFQLTPVRVEP